MRWWKTRVVDLTSCTLVLRCGTPTHLSRLSLLKFRYGVATDIGGGQTNQDAYGVFEVEAEDCVVMGVYDGHGRELGELASQVARDSFKVSLNFA